ncbi:MFS transporter [Streptomyces sp. RTd22]|uniref:MFS transporter n=1 Tax=Streptomyces sp. RTd22 TaxID=1841249 RepID=UPI00131B9F80|nr:MFS transporter [Streptomyces sp. RTd22]
MMRRAGTLLLPLVAVFLVPFTLTGASVALTDISEQLDASLAATQWVVNAYSATFAGFMLITGALADRLGRRRVFVSGVALFAVCALISAVAQDIVVLDVARLISGIGAAATTTGASAVLAEAFTGQARSKVFGLFGTTIGIGLAFGPTLAGLLVDSWGWRSAFALPGVIGLGCVVFYRSLPASRPATARGQLDRAGGTLFTLALLLLIFALVEGPELGWGSVAVAGSLIASVVLSGAFVAVERRVAEPLLDFRLFGTGRFLGLCLAVVAVVGLFGPLLTYLPAYFRAVAGMSTGEAGLSMVALTGPVLFIPLICGALVRWIPGSVQVVASLVLVAAGSAWLATGSSLLPALVVTGIGVAVAQGLLDGLAVDAVPSEHAGAAAGTFNTAKLTAETLGIAVVGAVLAARTGGRLSGPRFPEALHLTLWIFAGLCLVSAAATALLLRSRAAKPVAAAPEGERDAEPVAT